MRILVVDDSYATRNLIRRCVQQSGYPAPVEAKSMEEGLVKIDEALPELVILDLRLEDGKSFNFLKAFKEKTSSLSRPPVLFGLNGSNHPETSERALEEGVRLVVRKPFQPRFLTDRIDEVRHEMEEAKDAETDLKLDENRVDPPIIPVRTAVSDDLLGEARDKPEPCGEGPVIAETEKPDIEFTVRTEPADEPKSFQVRTDREQISFPARSVPEREPIVKFAEEELEPETLLTIKTTVAEQTDPLTESNEPAEVRPPEDIKGWRPRIRPPSSGIPDKPAHVDTRPDDEVFLINDDGADHEAPEKKKSLVSLFKGLFKKS